MQTLFTLVARIVADIRSVTVSSDGTTYFVEINAGTRPMRTLRQAVQMARDEIGYFLVGADRTKAPWGLYVSVANVAAFYGELPPSLPRVGAAHCRRTS